MEEAFKAAVIILICLLKNLRACDDQEYLSNEDLLKRLDNMADNDPSLASAYTIGFSSLGRELRALKITAAPEGALVPQVKLVGGVHGDEPPSTYVLVQFAKYLLQSYNNGEPYITWLLKNTRIHILPRLNPDGFEEALEGECVLGPGRKNGRGVDLNRAFPTAHMADDLQTMPLLEQEVVAVTQWTEAERFTLGAGLHSGALVAVYPLDFPLGAMDIFEYIDSLDLEEVVNSTTVQPSTYDEKLGEKAKTKDDDIFIYLAKGYAQNHIWMSEGSGCDGRSGFHDGIVNGAEWYQASGTMMDYSYLFAGTMELTLELYCCKYPPPRMLCHIWDQNKLPLLKFCAESVRGVRGVVSSSGIPLEMATVSVLGRDMVVSTNSKGQYFRILLPGRYILKVGMIGMESKFLEVNIAWQNTAYFTWTELNVDLQPEIPTLPPESTMHPEILPTNGSDPQGFSTPVSGFVDSSTTSFTEDMMTSLYDKGGIDPFPNGEIIYSDETEKFISNQSSVLVSKSTVSSSTRIMIISFSTYFLVVVGLVVSYVTCQMIY